MADLGKILSCLLSELVFGLGLQGDEIPQYFTGET